jgi:hypothetical protein
MKKSALSSGGYWMHPIRLVLDGVPDIQFAEEIAQVAYGQTEVDRRYNIRGLSTLVTNVDAALARTEVTLRECKRDVRKKKFWRVVELLREEPWFSEHPWVKDTVRRFGEHPRFMGKHGKRQKRKIDPLALKGLVKALVESRRARSRTAAYALLEEWGLMSVRYARRLYQKAQSETSCRAVVIVFPRERFLSEEAAGNIRDRTPFLQTGQKLTYAVEVPGYGLTHMTFHGISEGKHTKNFVVLDPSSLKIFRS